MTRERDDQAPATQAGASPVEQDRISGAELRVWLDWLGLTQAAAAESLGVRQDTVRRWLSGREPVPIRVGDELEYIERATAAQVNALVAALGDMRDPAVLIYRNDADMLAAGPRRPSWGAGWWRMVVARATVEIPGVEIGYWGQDRPR